MGATITTVKKTKIREKGFSGDRKESRFRKESGIGKIESIIIFNSLEIKTTPNERAKEKRRVFFETDLNLKLSVNLYPFLIKKNAIGATRNI